MRNLTESQMHKIHAGHCSAAQQQAMLEAMKNAARSGGFGVTTADEARMREDIRRMCL